MWSFLHYSERWYFFFPKIWSYPLGKKWKIIFLKKYMEKWYFVQIFWKDGIFKKMHWNMIFLVLSGKMVFFWLKDDLFSLDENWKTIFLKKYMETWYFLYVRAGATSMILCLSPKRNQRSSSPAKMHLRAIDILDWHSRKSANNSLYFYRDPYRRFHILLSSEEDPGNLIYRIEVWLPLQFIWLEIFCYEESLILCTIQSSDAVFGGVLGCQLRKLSDH